MEKSKTKGEEWGTSFLLTTNFKTYTECCFDVSLNTLKYKVTGWKRAVEVGEAGNLHVHLYVNFERSQRKSCIIKKFPNTDVKRITSGTERTVIEYVGNEDKEISKNCTIIDCCQWGDIDTTQGSRTDLTASDVALWALKEAIDSGESYRYLYNAFFPQMLRYGKGIKEYYDFCKQEKAESTSYKIETIEENALKEAEEIILLAIKEKNAIHRDLSNPICECGQQTLWNSIDRRFVCPACEA